MVREASITQEQVNAAADTLREAGTSPTVRAVRERLGQGSQATVMRLLNLWKAGQVKPAAAAPALSEALQRQLADAIALAVAEGQRVLKAELAELQQLNADLASESERQALDIGGYQESLEQAMRDRDAQAGRVVQLEADLAQAHAEADAARGAAEGARTELAKALLRLEALPRLEADLAAVRAELDKERAGRVAAEQAAAVAEAKREAEQAARTHVEGELTAARQLIERAEVKIERGEAYGRDLSDRMHALQAATYDANAKAQLADEQLRHAQEELAAVRAQLAALQAGPADATADNPEPAGPATRRRAK